MKLYRDPTKRNTIFFLDNKESDIDVDDLVEIKMIYHVKAVKKEEADYSTKAGTSNIYLKFSSPEGLAAYKENSRIITTQNSNAVTAPCCLEAIESPIIVIDLENPPVEEEQKEEVTDDDLSNDNLEEE